MTSPALTETDAVIGDWTIEGAQTCRIRLSAEDRARIEGALGVEMMGADVTGCTGLEGVQGWRPISMGLELTDEGGVTVAVFEHRGDDVYRSIDGRFILRRL